MDKTVKHLIWVCTIICLMVVLLCVFTFSIEDKTVYKNSTRNYSTQWYVDEYENGEAITLPYNTDVDKNTTFAVEKKIKNRDCGQTISFLSADSAVRVYVDDEVIYEFGYEDDRWFGSTPGSIWVFANIPQGANGKILRIEKVSPYDGYAGKYSDIIIGGRDNCILKFIKDNIIKLIECIMVVLGSIILVLVVIIMRVMKQDSKSLIYFVGFILVSNIYYMIETKLLIIFYGNETLYSILVFVTLILAPMFLTQYYKNRLLINVKKALTAIQIAAVLNCIIQIALQLADKVDFMQMAVASHLIIGLSIIVIIYGFISMPQEEKGLPEKIELAAVIVYMLGVAIDLIDTMFGKTGDLGQYSRFVNMIYTIIMVVLYSKYLINFNVNKFKDLNEKLKVEKQLAENANEEKSIFLGNMSHEIRTPIQGILGYNEMIIRESEDAKIDGYSLNIQAAARNLLGIVNQILDYTNIEKGVAKVNNSEYDLHSVIQDSVLFAEFGTKRKNIKLITELDENIPTQLVGDSTRVLQIINNLISNAVKYTDEGYVKIKMWWEYQKDNSGILYIQISDTGLGIKEEDIQKISDRFTRFDKINNSNISGVGLGLTIVNRLLKLMDGSFEINSEYEKGTIIDVKIPQDVIGEAKLGKWEIKNYNEDDVNNEYNFNKQVKILVVDDNDINLDVVGHTLRKNGVSVYTASNGEQALERLREDDRFDLIFMDHMMPVMDGIQALTQIKKLGLCNHTKIIAFTANAVDGVKQMYINAGFDDYITKPVSSKNLMDMVYKHISNDKKNIGTIKEDSTKSRSTNLQDRLMDNGNDNSVDGSNILVVDDEGMNLNIAQRMLGDRFNIYTARSGAEAFEILENEVINLILLDVHMPEMDGHEVINELKKSDQYKDIPVVFLTADSDKDTEVQGLSEGAMDFIKKPFIRDVVIGRITRILELDYLKKNLQNEVVKQTKKAEKRRKKVEQMSFQMVQTLASTIDAKDKYTNGHSVRVAEYSYLLAKAAGLKKEEIDNIKYAALLHDIGKIGVADSVLNKPGKLTDSEYEVIKSHTTIGSEILQNISTIETAQFVARHHHERYDGKGYPDKLKGENIPFEARIVCIADAYDAMNSRRVYRKNLTKEKIREELVKGRGTQFDPKYLDIFLDLFDNNELEIQEEKSSDPMIEKSGLILQKVMETMSQHAGENERDSLTGLMLRKEGAEAITIAMGEERGCLAFLDIDNLKKINDTIGHIAGDTAIKTVGELIGKDDDNTIACRIGGDEFLYYMKGFSLEQATSKVSSIIEQFNDIKKDNVTIKQTSLSAGLCMTEISDDFEDVRSKADKALYYIKQNGKSDYYVYKENDSKTNSIVKNVDLDKLVRGLEKSGEYEGALDMDYREFAKIFEFMKNVESRYDHEFKMALITLETGKEHEVDLEQIEKAMLCMEKSIQTTIRNVDVYTRYSSVQYLVILFEIGEENTSMVVNRVFQNFYKYYGNNDVELNYEIANMPPKN